MTFSVRFYKRLILVFLALLIVIPTVFAISFGVKSAGLERRLAQVEEGGVSPKPSGSLPPSDSVDPNAVPTGYDWTVESEPIEYQTLCPRLYGTAQVPEKRVRAIDTVYLTFDSTPGEHTREILDILDTYGIKATFFVSGTTDESSLQVMQDIVARGHAIGLGSYSGSLQEIYHSVADYLKDFQQIYDLVYETTNVKAEIFRFPRGSVNTYNSGIYEELIAEMVRRNFVFFDWNISGGDGKNAEEISDKVIENMADKDRGIVKFQDTAENEDLVTALKLIIEGLQGQGFSFQPLAADVLPVVFSYKSAS